MLDIVVNQTPIFFANQTIDLVANSFSDSFLSKITGFLPKFTSFSSLFSNKWKLLSTKEDPTYDFSVFKKRLSVETAPVFDIRMFNSQMANVTSFAQNGLYQKFSPYQYISTKQPHFETDEWLQQVDRSIALSDSISIIPEGISVSYLIKNEDGQPIAIFKPDDEAGGFENLKGKAFLSGGANLQSSHKELGARIVGGDFCRVPEIHQVKIIMNGKVKEGSLQKFIPNSGTLASYMQGNEKEMTQGELIALLSNPRKMWRYQKQHFTKLLDFFDKVGTDIHRMGLLDLMIQNVDRANPQNMLVLEEGEKIKLIPIDHNLAFPDQLTPMPPLISWFDSPYGLEPFDSQTLEFVQTLNTSKISKQLIKIGLSSEKIKQFEIMAMLIKKGTAAGLSLLEMSFMAVITNLLNPITEIAEIVKRVEDSLTDPKSDTEFFEKLSDELDKVFSLKQEEKSQHGVTKNLINFIPLLKAETYQDFQLFKERTEAFKNSLMGGAANSSPEPYTQSTTRMHIESNEKKFRSSSSFNPFNMTLPFSSFLKPEGSFNLPKAGMEFHLSPPHFVCPNHLFPDEGHFFN